MCRMRVRIAARVVLALSIAGMVAGSYGADEYVPPTSEAFVRGIRAYPFVAPVARRDKIRAGVTQLARCMPAPQVRKLLGDPDFGYIAYREGTDGKIPAMRIWNYILEKQAATEATPGTRVVVWLGNDGKLRAVTVHGARDIESNVSRVSRECP
jgi:hypothetical protein